jgi:NAD(P)-dependent dehydrogenase (short-subunit alcohol dehydrogenase family)
MRADLTGVFLCSQAAARVMVAQQSGAIINIASVSGQRGGVGRAAYGAAKAGVTLLTKVMAVELAPHGIRVNEIAPGPVLTEMSNQQHNEAVRRAYHDRIPMRRYGEQEEIADAAVFLASDESRYVNGHTLNVDGGFHAAGLMFDLAHGCAIAEPAGPPGRSSDRACGSSGNGPTSSLESSCAPPSKT